jgi:hypothetical protein
MRLLRARGRSNARSTAERRSDPPPAAPAWRWTLAAFAVFAVAYAIPFHATWLAGPRVFVPASSNDGENMAFGIANDTLFATWLVARNAYTILHRPHRLFDAEQCAPARNTLTLGEPMLTLGLLGTPAQLLSGDPILTYNFAILAVTLLGALAMYLLVADWTRVPAAGIVAALLYAFSTHKIGDITHPFVHDSGWTVWAIYFARRLFAYGRWRDAVGLSASCSLQMGASLYPFLAATLVGAPVLVWLLVRYGLRHVGIAPLLLVIGIATAAGAFVFGPYLEVRAGGGLVARTAQAFGQPSQLLPGGGAFPGWLVVGLVAAAFALGRRRATPGLEGDPRVALAIGGGLAAVASMGPNGVISRDLYDVLRTTIPGLGSVRGIASLILGLHLVLTLLAGLGTGALLGLVRLPSWGALAKAAAIVAAGVATLLPGALGLERSHRYAQLRARPDAAKLAFFEELARRGNQGPILEAPVFDVWNEPRARLAGMPHTPRRILLSAYHHRRTSACGGSHWALERKWVAEAYSRLPDGAAVVDLKRMGFTTLLVDLEITPMRTEEVAKSLEESVQSGSLLKRVYAEGPLRAYEIAP